MKQIGPETGAHMGADMGANMGATMGAEVSVGASVAADDKVNGAKWREMGGNDGICARPRARQQMPRHIQP